MKVLIFSLIASCFLFAGPVQAAEPADAEKIDINAATLENLVKIIHMGEVRATELISLRPFSSLDDLTRIKGIGEKRIEAIKKQGLAWVNSKSKSIPAPDIEPQPKPELQPIVYPSYILINEILPSPKGPDAEEEWIEIFNQNSFEVDISGWQITDAIGRTKSYVFPEKTLIEPKGFLILSRPVSKITLNNSGDSLNFLRPDEKIADSMSYKKAPQGQSYNRTDSKWVWSSILTPGAINILPAPIAESEQKTSSLKAPERGLAAVSPQIIHLPTRQNFGDGNIFVFIIALITAISSGIIILILKNKTKIRELK